MRIKKSELKRIVREAMGDEDPEMISTQRVVEFVEELEGCRDVIVEQLEQIQSVLRQLEAEGLGPMIKRSAEAYWLAHIKSALGIGEYPTHSPTMETTIRELRKEMGDEEEDDDDAPWGPTSRRSRRF